MANPTFSSSAVFDTPMTFRVGSFTVRRAIESLPGVNGAFLQHLGYSTRQITCTGYAVGSSTTGALAMAAAWADVDAIQDIAAAGTVADLVGMDATTYGNCVMDSCEPGTPVLEGSGSTWTCSIPCTVTFTQLAA